MRPSKSLTLPSSALIGSLVFVSLLLVALPKKGPPPEPELFSPEIAPKTARRRAPKAQPKAAPAASVAVPAADPVAALNDVLTKTDGAAEPTLEQMVARLVAIGPKALPMIVGRVCGAVQDDAADSDAANAAVDPQLLELRDRALHDAIAHFEPAQQLASIVERAADAPLDRRLVLVALLGEVDHPDAVRELIAMVAPIEPIHWHREYVRSPVTQALSNRFTAHPESLDALRKTLKDAQPELLDVIADACAQQPTSASVDLALALLDRSPELDLAVLQALARMNDAAQLALAEESLERLRGKLADSDAEIRRAAAAVLGAVHDFDAVEELVGLLADPEARVSNTAHWSLRAMVQTDLGDDLPAWDAYLDERALWHTDSAPELLALLASEDAGEVVKALASLLAEPQNRTELADAITPLLAREDPAVYAAACTALGSLGSARALPELVEALSSKQQSRRELAAVALRNSTGLQLPAKPAVWSRALGR